MSTPQGNLKRSFVQMARERHHARANYFAVLPGEADPDVLKEAARQYKKATEAFLAAILAYEQYLLSVERDIEMERELERVQNHKDFVTFVVKMI